MKALKLTILFALFSLTIMAQSNQEKVQRAAEMVMTAYNAKDYGRIEKEFNAQMSAAITPTNSKTFSPELTPD